MRDYIARNIVAVHVTDADGIPVQGDLRDWRGQSLLPGPVAPTITTQPAILPATPSVGDSITLFLGVASGNPAPTATWTLTRNGVNISDQVDQFMALEITDSGSYLFAVTWTNSAGSVAATSVAWTVAAPVLPPTLADLKAAAKIYIDKDSAITGSASAVTAVVNDGTMALSIPSTGSGADVQKSADGFVFADGKRLQVNPTISAASGCILIAEFVMTSLDASAASVLGALSSSSILGLRYSGTTPPGAVQYQHNAGGTVRNIPSGTSLALNAVQLLAVEWDNPGGRVRYFMNGDVLTDTVAPTADVTATVLQIASNFTGTLRKFALIERPAGGAWPMTLESALTAIGAGAAFGPFTHLRVLPALIQSEGRPVADNAASSAMLSLGQSRGVYIRGLQIVGKGASPIWGAGPDQLNQSVPAVDFGLAAGAMSGRASTVYTAQYAWAAAQPASRGVLIGDNGFGGVLAEQYLTSYPGYIGENNRYWLQEARRLAIAAGWTPQAPYLLHFVGTSAKTQTYAEAREAVEQVWDQFRGWCQSDFGQIPRPVVVQTGADLDTRSEAYHVTAAHHDVTKAYAGLIATSQRIWPIADQNIHPSAMVRVLIGEIIARAIIEDEAGRKWTPWPSVTKSGATVTVSFDLRPGETLANLPNFYADYGGAATCQHYGFEASGGIMSAVPDLDGNSVTITLEDPGAAWLRFAMQRQDVRAHVDGAGLTYSAHRTTLFASETFASAAYPGQVLRRALPSFSGNFVGDAFVFGPVA
ncbi:MULTISPECIES: hypothetical protein [unclassified Paracoccus (in: a-proteobacteria)]|uniref:hypothetical protein n=1 Tax=unclassified Paracoccus (in: a-proteobacteria) TaxID=2688777 RepID=UPI0012B28BEB|nr:MULTISPECIES: hypothetical protein [unclassified Paracoccus (in: a-proteobacteria)]UXU73836.1 immunoglobulin domain-containing protein [Paracoccus sp. SMMA_5]UXU79724.1 immunoglobulin domain-containing protein [Paracoccus sp. SMMA_5_TC]